MKAVKCDEDDIERPAGAVCGVRLGDACDGADRGGPLMNPITF
jgi:hypothetical protein